MVLMRIFSYIHRGVDPAALGVARVLYGLIMIIDSFEERGLMNIDARYGTSQLCTFPLLNDMPLPSLPFIHVMFLFMIICSFFVMIGFLFRISITCYAVMYWYLFFLNKTVWNNHSYLYGLLSVIFMLSSANNYWSVDGLIWPSIRNKKVPRWNYLVVKFQLFILYFFAGIKKLDSDWTSGYSMSGLGRKWIFDPFRLFLSNEMVDFVMVHLSGLFLDLTLGFQLICDKTRPIGYLLAYSFHGMNAIIFNIGMFSYMCMAMLPIFSRHDWPKKVITKLPMFMRYFLPLASAPQENRLCSIVDDQKAKNAKPWKVTSKTVATSIIVFFYVFAQITLPFSHSITKGYNSWTNGLYGYSWDMMVHSWSTQHIVVKLVDNVTEKTQYLRPGAFTLSRPRFFSHPDMMKQYAVCLARQIKAYKEFDMKEPMVYMDVWMSLNKRYQQRRIDPRVNLVTAKWSPFEDTPWLMPLLSELTPWRKRLAELKAKNREINNATEITFVADFPGLFLENYIAKELEANITVLSGEVVVETEGGDNITLGVNDTLSVTSDAIHLVHTVSEVPSCYMYVTFNTTWKNITDEEIENMPDVKRRRERQKEWQEKSVFEKFGWFLRFKYSMYADGAFRIYYAICVIFDIEMDEEEETKENYKREL